MGFEGGKKKTKSIDVDAEEEPKFPVLSQCSLYLNVSILKTKPWWIGGARRRLFIRLAVHLSSNLAFSLLEILMCSSTLRRAWEPERKGPDKLCYIPFSVCMEET